MNLQLEDATLNEANVPIWNGFIEITKERAVELFKAGEIVFGIDYEGVEGQIEIEEDLNNFEFFAIEKEGYINE